MWATTERKHRNSFGVQREKKHSWKQNFRIFLRESHISERNSAKSEKIAKSKILHAAKKSYRNQPNTHTQNSNNNNTNTHFYHSLCAQIFFSANNFIHKFLLLLRLLVYCRDEIKPKTGKADWQLLWNSVKCEQNSEHLYREISDFFQLFESEKSATTTTTTNRFFNNKKKSKKKTNQNQFVNDRIEHTEQQKIIKSVDMQNEMEFHFERRVK